MDYIYCVLNSTLDCTLLIHLYFLVPLPPALYPLIHRLSRHPIPHKPHNDAQSFYVLVPALVIEEEHISVINSSVPVYPLEMCGFTARINLQIVEDVNCTLSFGGGMRYEQFLEHVAAEVWGGCP